MRLTEKRGRLYVPDHVKKEGQMSVNHRNYVDMYNKLADLEDIEEELGIDLILFCNVMKNQVICVKGKEPEWADNGTKKDIVKYCVVRFTTEQLIVQFNEYCSNHIIANPLDSYGKTWALTKEELE